MNPIPASELELHHDHLAELSRRTTYYPEEGTVLREQLDMLADSAKRMWEYLATPVLQRASAGRRYFDPFGGRASISPFARVQVETSLDHLEREVSEQVLRAARKLVVVHGLKALPEMICEPPHWFQLVLIRNG